MSTRTYIPSHNLHFADPKNPTDAEIRAFLGIPNPAHQDAVLQLFADAYYRIPADVSTRDVMGALADFVGLVAMAERADKRADA